MRSILIECKAQSSIGNQSRLGSVQTGPKFNTFGMARELSSGIDKSKKNPARHKMVKDISSLRGIEQNSVEDDNIYNVVDLYIDNNFTPVLIHKSTKDNDSELFALTQDKGNDAIEANDAVFFRADASDLAIQELRKNPDVINIWHDEKLFPFNLPEPIPFCKPELSVSNDTALCTIAEIKNELGFSNIHAQGLRGENVIVAIVDGGIDLSKLRLKNSTAAMMVTNGWPGTHLNNVQKWGEWGGWRSQDSNIPHAHNIAETIASLVPAAKIWDLRIEDAGNHSNSAPFDDYAYLTTAFAALNWLIKQYKILQRDNENPPSLVVNCSWGVYETGIGSNYGGDRDHPLTQLFNQMIDLGIIVIFAAGNCGEPCTNAGSCNTHTGFGNSILGMNGHERAICVAAATLDQEYIPYSSQGPSRIGLNDRHPDICGISHFSTISGAYFNGTSAAAPIVCASAALMMQAKPQARQDDIQQALTETASLSGFSPPSNAPHYCGNGLIQPADAIARLLEITTNLIN